MNELTRLDLPAPVAPAISTCGIVARFTIRARPWTSLPRATSSGCVASLRGLRAQDVAEHHEVAMLVRHLDADRGLARDRRLDAHVGGGQRVGDVARQRQHLVDLGPRRHLDLVHRHRRTAVGGGDVSVDPEGPERALEGLLHLRSVASVGVRRAAPRGADRAAGAGRDPSAGSARRRRVTRGHLRPARRAGRTPRRPRPPRGRVVLVGLVPGGLGDGHDLVALGDREPERLLEMAQALLLGAATAAARTRSATVPRRAPGRAGSSDTSAAVKKSRRLAHAVAIGVPVKISAPSIAKPEAHDRGADRRDHVGERMRDERADHPAGVRDRVVAVASAPGSPPSSDSDPRTPRPSTEKPMNIRTRSSRAVSRSSRIPQ